jgi:hypothetical protein
MTRKSTAAWLALAIIAALLPAAATPLSTVSFTCISGTCSGLGPSLESNNSALTPGTLVTVGGFFAVGDGGGGNFVVLGQQSTALCNTYTVSGANYASGTVGSTQITFNAAQPASGLVVGELVSGSNTTGTLQITAGSEIASITTDPLTGQETAITLTLPMTGTATVPQTDIQISIAGSNGGTLLLDIYLVGGGPNCYQKTNYRGDPHEWGAYGDGPSNSSFTAHDDTAAIQNWLGAYGNAVNLPAGTAPNNFGPWKATIPATYMVSKPIFCPPNATIQGDENQTNNGSGSNPNPRVNFQATGPNDQTFFSGFSYQSASGSIYYGSQAVFGLNAFCRLSGIGVSGNNFELETNLAIAGTFITLSSGSAPYVGNAVYAVDPSGNVLSTDGTVVSSVTGGTLVGNQTNCSTMIPCTVNFSQAVGLSSSAYEFFFGRDAVDILANAGNVTIDGFSLLQNGRHHWNSHHRQRQTGCRRRRLRRHRHRPGERCHHLQQSCGRKRRRRDRSCEGVFQ